MDESIMFAIRGERESSSWGDLVSSTLFQLAIVLAGTQLLGLRLGLALFAALAHYWIVAMIISVRGKVWKQ